MPARRTVSVFVCKAARGRRGGHEKRLIVQVDLSSKESAMAIGKKRDAKRTVVVGLLPADMDLFTVLS